MNDRTALFANVLNAPSDDTARLVLADWLEEHGEESFGRFIRAGVVVSQYGDVDFVDDPAYYAAIAEIASIAKRGESARWLASIGIGPHPLTNSDWSWDNTGGRVTVRIGSCAGVFALVAGIAKESAAIVEDLMDAAGDRWPSPRRR